MSSGGDGRLPSQSRSQSQQQRQYDGISNSISSNSLSGSLRKNTLDEQPLQQQQHVRDRSQYAQDPPQDYARYQAPGGSVRGNSVDSINFAQLSMHDAPSRTPSQPATAASLRYASPSPEVRRPDSRTQHNGSSYVQAPRNATPASQYAAEYQATHPSQPQQHPSYAQRLSYDNPRPDLANTPSEAGYPDQYQQQQEYQNQYAYAEPSSSYVASTSQQPYGYGQAPDPIYQHQGGYTEDPNAYYAQQNQVQDQYYDPNAQYYAQGGYDQQQYNHYQHGQDPTQMYNQGYGDAGQPYPNGPSYSSHEHQAPPSQQHNGDYFGEPSRVSSSSFSQSSLPHYPALNRNKTTVSAKSSVSAADKVSSTQPITKQAVDDYRNRIKSDPDPETQFNFARFLIEAARRLAVAAQQGSVDDAKSVKKYRDSLLQEAIKLIKRLAMQGSGLGKPAYADAQFFLANCLGHGALGLNVDHEKAYNLYVQASKQNHPAATYRTAVCNEVGAGTRREPARAVLFYRKASALGDTAGMYKLGMILLNGLLGQQKNPREAVIWLKKAAAQADEENPHALHELGVLYEKPVEYMQNGQATPSPVVRDEAQAREFYTQAAQLGHAPSQCKLGACYEYGSLTCPVDPRRSIAWYTRAAEKGHAESELALSGWYLTGSPDVLKPSDSEAYLWARRAANKGLSKAEYAVGYYSEIGIGVKPDLDEAKMWYLRAAASGNRRAMQRLSELKKLGNRKAQQGARPTRQQAEKECIIM